MDLFNEEYHRVAADKPYITLKDIMKLSVPDDLGEQKINLVHLRK